MYRLARATSPLYQRVPPFSAASLPGPSDYVLQPAGISLAGSRLLLSNAIAIVTSIIIITIIIIFFYLQLFCQTQSHSIREFECTSLLPSGTFSPRRCGSCYPPWYVASVDQQERSRFTRNRTSRWARCMMRGDSCAADNLQFASTTTSQSFPCR